MRRPKEETRDLYKKFLEIRSLFPDMSTREMAKMVGVSHTTVRRWMGRQKPKASTENKFFNFLYSRMDDQLKAKLRTLIEHLSKRKGLSRRTAKPKIFAQVELDLGMLGVKNEKQGIAFIDYFVEREYGSWEALEQKTRPKKERTKYRTNKGKLEKKPGQFAVDATAINFIDSEGKEFQLSVFFAGDVYTGYLWNDPLMADNGEKAVLFYNKAFNSRNVAKYLIEIFSIWGVPEEMISDSDPVLRNDYMDSALFLLNVKRTFVKHPGQNPIERYIKEIKEWVEADKRPVKDKEDAIGRIKTAIERFNKLPHKFDHFKEEVVPEEILPAGLRNYTKEEEEVIRKAFMEVAVRVVRNSTISWDGYKYVFNVPERLRRGEIGRRPKPLEVIVKRHVDNASYLEVYHKETKEFLGFAQLHSQDVPTIDPTERKEIKDRERRAKRREKKLTKEMDNIKLALAKEPEMKEEEEETIEISILSKLAQKFDEEV